MDGIESGNFGLPLDAEDAKNHVNGRRKTLVKVFTEGFSSLVYMIECGMESYGDKTRLCLIPYKEGIFEIVPVYKAGVHLPTCLPGIDLLWSKLKSSKTEFIREATLISNTWLVAYAAYLSSRLEPSANLPIWIDIAMGESVKTTVEKYYLQEEANSRAETAKAGNRPCSICEAWKAEVGVCCTKCFTWNHQSCAATRAAEDLDRLDLGTSTEKTLVDVNTYRCRGCQ